MKTLTHISAMTPGNPSTKHGACGTRLDYLFIQPPTVILQEERA